MAIKDHWGIRRNLGFFSVLAFAFKLFATLRDEFAAIRHPGGGRATLALASVAVATGWLCVTAAAAQPPIAFFEQGAISLSTAQVKVQLVNNTVEDWNLSATAYLAIVDDAVSRMPVPVEVPKQIRPQDRPLWWSGLHRRAYGPEVASS